MTRLGKDIRVTKIVHVDRSVDTNNNNMCFMAIIFTFFIQKIKCNSILLYLALYCCTGIYRNNHFQERTVKMLKKISMI
jgi:hypothetical protein